MGEKCPVCGKSLTVGVMHQVEKLAQRVVSLEQLSVETDERGVRWINTPKGKRPGYAMSVPLQEILSEVFSVGVGTKTVLENYLRMTSQVGPEFHILLEADLKDIGERLDPRISEAIRRVRGGELHIEPGYDGKYGEVKIFHETEASQLENKRGTLL